MRVHFGYTPDTDDAFHYYALQAGKLDAGGDTFEFSPLPIQRLNELALEGALEVSAVSSIVYPLIDDRYAVLAAGSSVGRGYGPALGVKSGRALGSLEGRTVAVPGLHTTGNFLLNYFYSGFRTVFLPHDEIAHAIESGAVDAGVLIHEELLNYRLRGVDRVCCLGERWFEETGLPLPVGLTVARRDLGAAAIERLRGLLESSMRYALEHRDEAMAFASRFSTGSGEVTTEFVNKFANLDTASMPGDVRLGLAELYRRAHRRGLIGREPALEIVG